MTKTYTHSGHLASKRGEEKVWEKENVAVLGSNRNDATDGTNTHKSQIWLTGNWLELARFGSWKQCAPAPPFAAHSG
jgi:hypothetical protein